MWIVGLCAGGLVSIKQKKFWRKQKTRQLKKWEQVSSVVQQLFFLLHNVRATRCPLTVTATARTRQADSLTWIGIVQIVSASNRTCCPTWFLLLARLLFHIRCSSDNFSVKCSTVDVRQIVQHIPVIRIEQTYQSACHTQPRQLLQQQGKEI